MLTKAENDRIQRACNIVSAACEILPSAWCYDSRGQLLCHCCPISKAMEQMALCALPSEQQNDSKHIPE